VLHLRGDGVTSAQSGKRINRLLICPGDAENTQHQPATLIHNRPSVVALALLTPLSTRCRVYRDLQPAAPMHYQAEHPGSKLTQRTTRLAPKTNGLINNFKLSGGTGGADNTVLNVTNTLRQQAQLQLTQSGHFQAGVAFALR